MLDCCTVPAALVTLWAAGLREVWAVRVPRVLDSELSAQLARHVVILVHVLQAARNGACECLARTGAITTGTYRANMMSHWQAQNRHRTVGSCWASASSGMKGMVSGKHVIRLALPNMQGVWMHRGINSTVYC